MFDGAVARATGTVRPFGAFLDSVLDRFAEAAVLAGLVYYYASLARAYRGVRHDTGADWVVRGELRAGTSGRSGSAMQRGLVPAPGTRVLLGAGLILNDMLLFPAIVALTLLTFVTVWQRMRHVAWLLDTALVACFARSVPAPVALGLVGR